METLLIPTKNRDWYLFRFAGSLLLTIILIVCLLSYIDKIGIDFVAIGTILGIILSAYASKKYFNELQNYQEGGGILLDQEGLSFPGIKLQDLWSPININKIPWSAIKSSRLEEIHVKYHTVKSLLLELNNSSVLSDAIDNPVTARLANFSILRIPLNSIEENAETVLRHIRDYQINAQK